MKDENLGSLNLHSVGSSTQYKDLKLYKDYYFTKEIIEECLHECAQSEHTCPAVDLLWTLHDVDIVIEGDVIETNYYEEINGTIVEPSMTQPETTYSRVESIQLEGSEVEFSVKSSEYYTILFAQRVAIEEGDILSPNDYKIAELPLGAVMLRVGDDNSGTYF